MRRSPDRLARYHAYSGLLISLFAALHLMNHAAAFGGPSSFSHFRTLLRYLYQSPLYEPACLVAPVLFSLVTGIWMLVRTPPHHPRPAAPGLRLRLQRWSGVCLVVFLLPHAVSTRGAALLWGIDTDFHFIARTLSGWRGGAFWLIYGLLVLATSYHLSNGLFTLLDESGTLGSGLSRRIASAAFCFVGATLIVCGLLGLLSYGGVIYPRPSVETLPSD